MQGDQWHPLVTKFTLTDGRRPNTMKGLSSSLHLGPDSRDPLNPFVCAQIFRPALRHSVVAPERLRRFAATQP